MALISPEASSADTNPETPGREGIEQGTSSSLPPTAPRPLSAVKNLSLPQGNDRVSQETRASSPPKCADITKPLELGGGEAFLHKSRASSSPEVDQSEEGEGCRSAPNTRDVFFNTTV